MDTRVEALISLLEDLERLERRLLHLVETNEACALETRAYLADNIAQVQNRGEHPWLPQRNKPQLLALEARHVRPPHA